MTQKKILHILNVLMLVLLVLPFFQEQTGWIGLKKLAGYIPKTSKPEWTWKSWITGDFQKQSQTFLNENLGFRSLFIRINNQIDFSLFRISHANGVVIGKNGYLYETNYIKDYTGEFFGGEEILEDRLARIRLLQDILKQQNIDLVLVFNPGKASFYPEYIPESFHPEKHGISNYTYLSERSRELGINNIDFNRYFLQMKDTATWPLYPKCGIHWSIYGMTLCADSLFKYISKIRNIRMREFGWNGLDVPDTLRDTDNDIGDGMNLLFNIKTPRGAYPRFYFKDRPGMTKPDVLVVGDSFYWSIVGNGLANSMFNKSTFWFYFERANSNTLSDVDINLLDVKKEIDSHQVVILMGTEANLYRFPYGFLEKVYPLYFPSDSTARLDCFRKLIRWDKSWLREVEKSAALSHISLDEAINAEARLTLKYKDSLQMTEKDYTNIIAGITSDKAWMEKEKQKAVEKKQTLEQVLREDARWVFTRQPKNYHRKYWPGFN